MPKKLLAVVALPFVLHAACVKPGAEEPDVCDEARQHMVECGFPEADDEECNARNRCVAECINEASCDELDTPDPDGDYLECLVECEEETPDREACDDALARLASCGVDTSGIDPNRCTTTDSCVAECINEASCTEITEEDPESPYARCLGGC